MKTFWILGIIVLHLMDAAMTIWALQHGAVEVNPLMRWAHAVSPVFFLIFKMGLVVPSVMFLWWQYDKPLRRFVRLSAKILFFIVLLVVFWNAGNLAYIFFILAS